MRPVVTRRVTVRQANGLHLRPAEVIARTAERFDAEMVLSLDGVRADATSIFDLIGLIAEQGSVVLIEGSGPDAEQAVETIEKLFENDFETPSDPASDSTAP